MKCLVLNKTFFCKWNLFIIKNRLHLFIYFLNLKINAEIGGHSIIFKYYCSSKWVSNSIRITQKLVTLDNKVVPSILKVTLQKHKNISKAESINTILPYYKYSKKGQVSSFDFYCKGLRY